MGCLVSWAVWSHGLSGFMGRSHGLVQSVGLMGRFHGLVSCAGWSHELVHRLVSWAVWSHGLSGLMGWSNRLVSWAVWSHGLVQSVGLMGRFHVLVGLMSWSFESLFRVVRNINDGDVGPISRCRRRIDISTTSTSLVVPSSIWKYKQGGLSKIEPNHKSSITFDPHVGLVILTVNQI